MGLLVDFITGSIYQCILFIALDTIMILRSRFAADFTGEIIYHISFLLMRRGRENKMQNEIIFFYC